MNSCIEKFRMMSLLKILFSLPKTTYVNFRLFPFKSAIKLPLWVTYDTKLWISGGDFEGKG